MTAVTVPAAAAIAVVLVAVGRARRSRLSQALEPVVPEPRVRHCTVFCVACTERLVHFQIPDDEAHCHCYIRGGTINLCSCPCHDERLAMQA